MSEHHWCSESVDQKCLEIAFYAIDGRNWATETQKCFQQRVNLAGLIMEEHSECVSHTRWQKRSDGQYDFTSPGFCLNLM